MNCTGCTFVKFPNCAIQSIITAISLEDIITGNSTKNTLYPVCHKNAQSVTENIMTKGSLCDECHFCNALCINNEFKFSCDETIEKIIFSNLNRFNMYLKRMLSKCIIASEVKAKGNAREKRIDIVIKKDHIIYLIKVLNDNDKIPYYSRSYTESTEYYSSVYSNILFKKVILLPQKHVDESCSLNHNCKTVDELISELTEV